MLRDGDSKGFRSPMGKQSESRLIRRLYRENLIPGYFTAATMVAGSLADASVTGRCLGKEALASFGLANPVIFLTMGLSGMIGVGMTISMGRVLGSGRREKAQEVFSSAVIGALGLGVLVMLILLLFPTGIVALMGARAELLPEAAAYLRGYSLGIPAYLMQGLLNSTMPLDGDKIRCVYSMVIATAVNIALDLLFCVVMGMGLLGMALATSISYYVLMGVFLLHFMRKDCMVRLSLTPLSAASIREVLLSGTPFSFQMTCRMLAVVLVNRIILSVSTADSVAVYSLMMSSSNLILIDGMAGGTAVMTLDSCFVGEKDAHSILSLMRIALRHAVLVNIMLFGLYYLAAPWMVQMFSRDALICQNAVPAMRLFALSAAVYAVNYILRIHLQCCKHTLYALLFVFLDVLAGPVLAAFVLAHIGGTGAIWALFVAGEGAALLSFPLFAMLWGKKLPHSFAELLLIEPSWLSESDEAFEAVLEQGENALGRAAEISEEAVEFLLDRGVEHTKAIYLGICIEELCTNIVRHGFSSASDTAELRLSLRDGIWTLRIRDHCRHFDVQDYFRLKDKAANQLGLRIVEGIAKDLQYLSTLKMNQVIIRV